MKSRSNTRRGGQPVGPWIAALLALAPLTAIFWTISATSFIGVA